MSSGMFADHPDYIKYEHLLIRLNDRMARGLGETEEADALREEMFDLRQGLSNEEEARLEGLSADLYMLQDDEVFEQASPDERAPESLAGELASARRAGDWERALSVLRKGHDYLPRSEVAHVRAQCYERLGHIKSSQLFADYAARLDPANSSL
jgi:hypothetical protein